ncbi:PP2C family protein-serine/threonine phosphatase [bacterium SCSIO 12741]|nr:PP2C family protein-serine/threonine phosphatase [bacterium SCSIO 12741]
MAINPTQREKLAEAKFQFRRILQITTAINNNESGEALYAIFEEILAQDLHLPHLLFYTCENKQWGKVIHIGFPNWTNQIPEKELHRFHEITSLGVADNELFPDVEMVIPVYHKERVLGVVLLKDQEDEVNRVSPLIKNLNYIQSLANIIMVAIENKRMAKEALNQERIRNEMKLAGQIQKGLLPQNLPYDDRIQAAAFHQSHDRVGGDYYDMLEIRPGEYVFCMADISGKGVSAALIMSNFQASFRSLIRMGFPLPIALQELNRVIVENTKGTNFLTLFIGHYNSTTRELSYINCAHPDALLIEEGIITPLKSTLPGIGMLDKLPDHDVATLEVIPGAYLVCSTDGVTEAENLEGEMFQSEGLMELLNGFDDAPPEEINKKIVTRIEDWLGDQPHADDLAILSVRFC